MTKAEQFIKDCTRDCSNEIVPVKDVDKPLYHEWLTPEQALKAIEIERNELLDKACDAYCKVCGHFIHAVVLAGRHDCRYLTDFKKYMKGE